jgi:hypothetical protein
MTRSSDERGGYIGEELRAGRVPQNVEDRTVAEQAAEWMSPEDKIRQGGRIGDSTRRHRDDLERWSQEVLANLGTWATQTQAVLVAALTTQGEKILELEAKLLEVTEWRSGFEVYMGQAFTTLGDRIKGLELILEENGISRPVRGSTNTAEELLELQNRVSDLELQARSRDDYEAEMRDRG